MDFSVYSGKALAEEGGAIANGRGNRGGKWDRLSDLIKGMTIMTGNLADDEFIRIDMDHDLAQLTNKYQRKINGVVSAINVKAKGTHRGAVRNMFDGNDKKFIAIFRVA